MAVINGTSGEDTLNGTSEADTISAAAGNDTIFGSAGNDVIDGGDGFDILTYQDYGNPVTVDLRDFGAQVRDGGGKVDGITLIERLFGTAGADSFTGRTSTGDGTFGFVGRQGADSFNGLGNLFNFATYIDSPAGITAVLQSGSADTGFADDGWGFRDTFAAMRGIRGSEFADSLTGSAGNDWLIGAGGNDRFTATGGNDLIDGGFLYDILFVNGVGRRSAGTATQTDGTVQFGFGGKTDVLTDIEDIRFVDGRIAFAQDDAAAQVVRMYDSAFNRTGDQAGLNFHIGRIQNGGTIAQTAGEFLASAEAQSTYGNSTTTQYVERLYQNVLNRSADAAGRDFWVGEIDSGRQTRTDMLVTFSESAEHRALTAPTVAAGIWDLDERAAQVARLYDTTFERLPDVPGLSYHVGNLNAGFSLNQVAAEFVGSAEFQATYGSLGNQAFVERVYQNTLNRAGDQAGINYWTGQLNSGVARSDVALAFSESAEHVAITAPNIQSESQFGIAFA